MLAQLIAECADPYEIDQTPKESIYNDVESLRSPEVLQATRNRHLNLVDFAP